MEAKVTWKGRLSFTGTADSGFSVPLGGESEVGGDNDGFSPLELMAVSLAGCTAMDVISILHKKQQDVTAFEVYAHIERKTEHPRVFSHIVLEYAVTGHKVEPAAVARAVQLSKEKYCPAQAMLGQVVPIEIKIVIHEAE